MVFTSRDIATKAWQNNASKILYKARMESNKRREDMYMAGKGKTYALLWDRCSNAIQNKI